MKKVYTFYICTALAFVFLAIGMGLYVWYLVQHVDQEVRAGDTEALMPISRERVEEDAGTRHTLPVQDGE